MLASLLLLLPSLVGIIPGIINAFASKDIAAINADAQVKTASATAFASVETKWWLIGFAIFLYALIFIVYDAKAVVWDNVINGGNTSTPPLRDALNWVHLTVVGGLFLRWAIK